MPRETLDKNILNIKEEIIMLSSMVEQAMHNSIGLFRFQEFRGSPANSDRGRRYQWKKVCDRKCNSDPDCHPAADGT